MSRGNVPCPYCGTGLTINHESTKTVVCSSCQRVLTIQEGTWRSVGKINPTARARSPLSNGLTGTFRNKAFQITGHVVLSNDTGATWEEWYLGLDDGTCGWLAHAQGRWMLSFPAPAGEANLPRFEQLDINRSFDLIPGRQAMACTEKGEARVESASGQIPYLLTPGETYRYADFAAMNGTFASIDYSDTPPSLFIGREVSLKELGIEAEAQPQASSRAPSGASTGALYCTDCGNGLEIRNPGRTERVTCSKCRALFDVSKGTPRKLESQAEREVHSTIAVGSVGVFPEGELTVVGYIIRETTDDEGNTYEWEEYLLSGEDNSYYWLSQFDGHWNFATPVAAGSDIQPIITFEGRDYKLFQHGEARITYLEGEFYWNAQVGDVSYTADFIAPPEMLSVEYASEGSDKGEQNWTLGRYLTKKEVEQAFGLEEPLPRPIGVAPNQPWAHNYVYWYWLLSIAAVIGIFIFSAATTQTETVLDWTPVKVDKWQDPPAQPGVAAGQQKFAEWETTLKIRGGKNIRVSARADLQSTWVGLSGVIMTKPKEGEKEDAVLVVQPFDIPIEHYSGTEGGENWSEGNKNNSVTLGSLPEGEYLLKLGVFTDPRGLPQGAGGFGGGFGGPAGAGMAPAQFKGVDIQVTQGHARGWYLVMFILLLSILPFIVWLVHKSFEARRWANSNVNPGGT